MNDHDCIYFNGGVMMVGPASEYSDAEVLAKRRKLARRWRCKVDQVMDSEAIAILREEKEALAALEAHDAE